MSDPKVISQVTSTLVRLGYLKKESDSLTSEVVDALKAFQAGNLKKADEAFSAFANKYPKSPYLPLALYWGGNSKYANKDYTGAISQLQSLIKRYPNHPRIPTAMVTLGNSQLESGNKAAAKKTFNEIIAKYPDTDAARDAQQLIAATK